MIASMTGYGRTEMIIDDYRVVVEISTVNNRYLDFQLRLPRTLIELEPRIKKLLSSKLRRGKVNFSLAVENNVQTYERLSLNADLADMYHNILNDLKTRYNLPGQIDLEHFVNLPDLITTETSEIDIEKSWLKIEPVCVQALDSIYQMRLTEGQNLYADFKKRLGLLTEFIAEIKRLTVNNVDLYRNKLKHTIQEIIDDYPVDDQRIAMEVALAAEKMDVTEEITRLSSHIDSFSQSLDEKSAIGKRLIFILQ